jgi:hypothetical protein
VQWRLRRITAIALLTCAGSVALLHAQNAALVPPKTQNAPESLPAAPAASAIQPDADVSAFGSYQRQIPLATPLTAAGKGFDLGSRSFINPFQPAANFGNHAGSTSSGLDFNGSGRFGTTRQPAIGFNQFSSFGTGVRQGNPATRFPPFGVTSGPFGVTPQPNLNQLMRGAFNLPLNSSSTFRFQYSGMLTPGGNLSDLARPYGSVLFTTSDLGNGMFLSAGTYNSGHNAAGTPAASLGNDTSAPKHSASGVAIKLSF